MTKKRKVKSGPPMFIWVLLLIAGGALVYRFGTGGGAGAGHHPEPRAGITGAEVQDATRFADVKEIADIYAMAKEVPDVLDGLYCHCDCSKHAGHRSLLTCFQSEHGSGCDVCLGEAALAYEMHKDGKSLDEIRAAIDAQYSRG